MKFLILPVMIFIHILADFNLQGYLATLKQKSYWEENAPDKMYKEDYMVALFLHSFSWSFMIMLVPVIYILNFAISINTEFSVIIAFFFINIVVHAVTDDLKANEKILNLKQDQFIHLIQIVVTFLVLIY